MSHLLEEQRQQLQRYLQAHNEFVQQKNEFASQKARTIQEAKNKKDGEHQNLEHLLDNCNAAEREVDKSLASVELEDIKDNIQVASPDATIKISLEGFRELAQKAQVIIDQVESSTNELVKLRTNKKNFFGKFFPPTITGLFLGIDLAFIATAILTDAYSPFWVILAGLVIGYFFGEKVFNTTVGILAVIIIFTVAMFFLLIGGFTFDLDIIVQYLRQLRGINAAD